MRTKFDRVTAENGWFAFAKKADNATETLFPRGSGRRKLLNALTAVLLFLPKMCLALLRKVYRIFRPHPDDVRRKQLKQ